MDGGAYKILREIVIGLPVLLFSISFHEAAHGLVAWKLGDDTARRMGRVSLDPFRHLDLFGSVLLPLLMLFSGFGVVFGYAKPTPVNVNRLRRPKRDFSLVAAAGPLSNLLLALAFTALAWLFAGVLQLSSAGLDLILAEAIFLNLLLALFNLMPLPTLDGLKALYAFLPDSWCWRLNRLEVWGLAVVVAALFLGVFNLLDLPLGVATSWLFRLGHLNMGVLANL